MLNHIVGICMLVVVLYKENISVVNRIMYYLEDYSRLVIEPLEDFKKEVIRKYIKSFFFKKSYEELLDKIEVELIKKYEKYYEMSVEEYEF